jgi:hypothetical protein
MKNEGASAPFFMAENFSHKDTKARRRLWDRKIPHPTGGATNFDVGGESRFAVSTTSSCLCVFV